jgi:hypothetical protein
MIKLRNKHLAAVTAISGLGIAAIATPAAALAASHPAHAKVVRTDPASPDRPGTKDTTKHDTKSDKAGSVDKASIDRASLDKPLDG